jgi:glycosyltransferase involved in cell wall biosynthesis
MAVAKNLVPKKMSILWISYFIDNNPALHNILNQLSEMGHSPSLISVQTKNPSQAKNAKIRIISAPLKHISLFSPVMFAILLFFYLPLCLATSKTNVVIMEPYPQILSAFPSLLISKIRKVKFILDIRTTPVEAERFRGFLTRFWFSLSVLVAKRFLDGITIITPLMKKEVCDRFNLDPARVGVWTSGVSDSLFNPANFIHEKEEIKRKFGLTGKFVVFYHGVFTPTRGLAEVIAALKILMPRYPDMVFFLLGDGPFAPSLRALIKRQNLEKNVIIAKSVDQVEVPKFISMCDIAVVPLPDNPYWRFQSPLKLLEYLAMEKVVVVTDIPAHRAVVGDAKCGVYISSIKPEEIAKALEHVYLNKDSLREGGKIGREIVLREYTWEKVARNLEDYLVSIVELSRK